MNLTALHDNFEDPLAILFIQIVMILSGTVFWVDFKKIGQPTVIGET
jgi:hypothetical protein